VPVANGLRPVLSSRMDDQVPDRGAALRGALEHIRNGRPDAAEALCRRLAGPFPAEADVHHLLGVVALGRKDLDPAMAAFRRAIALAPQVTHYYSNLGTAQRAAGVTDAAEGNYRRALRLVPGQAETLSNRANLLVALERYDEALPLYRMAVALRPEHAKLYGNLGDLFLKMQRPAKAVHAYETANILAGGRFHDVTVNLGMAYQRLNALPDALRCYDQAVARQPENPAPHWNRALAWLVSGNLTQGWREYEWRWRLAECPPRQFDRPLWSGEPLDGRTILLHAEQGLGDTLQFVRYLPMVAARGGRIVLECQPSLCRLLAASFPDAAVVAAGDPLPAFDVHLPLLSLPGVFGTTLDTIPASVPYLRVPDGIGSATGPFVPRRGAPAVGLVWGGDPAHRNDRQRSLDTGALRALLATPGVAFVSLQKGERARVLDRLGPEFGVIDRAADLGDFADTAAAMAQLDLVVTVDTSVAHLAGALGRPVCVMLPFAPDWRWLLDRRDSPWYPTATLFRQEAPGDWLAVVGRIARHLQGATQQDITRHPPLTGQPGQATPLP